jgi:hypothetical protein
LITLLAVPEVGLGAEPSAPDPPKEGDDNPRETIGASTLPELPPQAKEAGSDQFPDVTLGAILAVGYAATALIGFVDAANAHANAERINARFNAIKGGEACSDKKFIGVCDSLDYQFDRANLSLGIGIVSLVGIAMVGGAWLTSGLLRPSAPAAKAQAAVVVMPGGVGFGVTGSF